MSLDNLTSYSSSDYNNLSQFEQEEITNNFKEAILYKMKEKHLQIDDVCDKAGYTARQLSSALYSDSVNYETHAELQRILAVVNSI
ncbi:hypothetical protein ACFO26_00360 [Lactococcus nasutitermitis]|uniref:Phage protein n=1 Tax=Lactococcus nasutitermitis TaxID=1652957 RepID=A0ABV9JAH0_9LACT|nr:hypothetical protein [Lactococcus nasutitermitis]